MAGFLAEEGDGEFGLDSPAELGAGQAGNAARQVDGDDARTGKPGPLQGLGVDAVDRLGEASPEQRIDDHRRTLGREMAQRSRLDAALGGRQRRVGSARGGASRQSDTSRPARRRCSATT